MFNKSRYSKTSDFFHPTNRLGTSSNNLFCNKGIKFGKFHGGTRYGILIKLHHH